jgi:(1->4)-alpha-D-glucan 1-alpha-D-glucosylmutase
MIVGAWPMDLAPPDFTGVAEFAGRIAQHMLKAAREAKLRTSWTLSNADYEAMVERFVLAALDPARSAIFLANVFEFQAQIGPTGAVNGLAQTLLKLTVPGVPDIYQGCEYWDMSLVDPDNRRPVDYGRRTASLADPAIDGAAITALLESWRDGRIKQHMIRTVLELRQQMPALFAAGDYQPLSVTGAQAEHVVAFARRGPEGLILVVAPRLVARLIGEAPIPLPPVEAWGDTTLTLPELPGPLSDILSGNAVDIGGSAVPVGALLAQLPAALLVARAPGA